MRKEILFNKDEVVMLNYSTTTTSVLVFPLQMRWEPKPDITTHELALCLPYLLRVYSIMPWEVDKNAPHMRHFEIYDPNDSTTP
jgi:hypothetical protein